MTQEINVKELLSMALLQNGIQASPEVIDRLLIDTVGQMASENQNVLTNVIAVSQKNTDLKIQKLTTKVKTLETKVETESTKNKQILNRAQRSTEKLDSVLQKKDTANATNQTVKPTPRDFHAMSDLISLLREIASDKPKEQKKQPKRQDQFSLEQTRFIKELESLGLNVFHQYPPQRPTVQNHHDLIEELEQINQDLFRQSLHQKPKTADDFLSEALGFTKEEFNNAGIQVIQIR